MMLVRISCCLLLVSSAHDKLSGETCARFTSSGCYKKFGEQDNASKEKAKTMVEELQCKSLTAPESDTVQQDWAAHRATWLDETSNALPHHRKGERGQRKKDGLAPNASDSDEDALNGSETRIPIAC